MVYVAVKRCDLILISIVGSVIVSVVVGVDKLLD